MFCQKVLKLSGVPSSAVIDPVQLASGSFHGAHAATLEAYGEFSTNAIWVSTSASHALRVIGPEALYGKVGNQSGIRTTTLAPTSCASFSTCRTSPPGAVSPFGSWPPSGAIWTNVLGFSAATTSSLGSESVASP